MSPEQLRGNTVTPASDLYSLALVAYELLTGDRAIGDNNTITIITSQLSADPIRLPDTAKIPYGLATIINHMLHKDPAARYQDAAEVLEDLDRWIDNYRNASEPTSHDLTHAVQHASARLPQLPANLAFPGADDVTHHPANRPQKSPPPPLNPLLQAPHPQPQNESTPKKHRWIPILAILLILIGIIGFITQQVMNTQPENLIELGNQPLAENTQQIPTSTQEPELQPQNKPPASTANPFMVVVTDPARAELFINHKSIGTSPQRVDINPLKFPVFIKARLPDGRETSEALTEPTDLLELRFAPSSAPAPPARTTTPSTQRPAPATTSNARSIHTSKNTPKASPTPANKPPNKPPIKAKPKSSFPALDSL